MRGKVTRRVFLGGILAVPFAFAVDAWWVEPTWVKTRRVRIGTDAGRDRLVQISDIHFSGNRIYLEKVVRQINALSPEFVCFTGDLVNEEKHLAGALEILAGIRAPLYGVPGNHDCWTRMSFAPIRRCFAATGGAWLESEQVLTRDGRFAILGLSAASFRHDAVRVHPGTRNICLMHFPAWVDRLRGWKFDLILAGHSHGGQVRIPFWGPVTRAYGVEQYDLGLFETEAGPLYVNPGIGYFPVPIRFRCRPEITLFEI